MLDIGSDRAGTQTRDRSSSVPFEPSSSYIQMSDSQIHHEQQPHVREDSGYTQSTLGSSVPPMNTIGVKRGAELLRSRPHASTGPKEPGAIITGPAGFDGRSMPRFEEAPFSSDPRADPDIGVQSNYDIPDYLMSRDLEADASMADTTTAPSELLNKDREFYLLQGKGPPSGHVLSAEALAGEFYSFCASGISKCVMNCAD